MKTPALPGARGHSLQLHLMLAVLVGAAVFAALAGTLAFRLEREKAIEDSRRTLQGLAQAIEKSAAIGTFAADPVLLRELADGLAGNALIARVEMRTMAGKTLASKSRDVPSLDSRWAATADHNIVIDTPLRSPFDASEQIGVLRLDADDDHIAAIATRAAQRQAALMAGQAALVALLLYAVTAHLVSRPIVRLARSLRSMSPGTAERLSTPRRHERDEIGALIAGANALLEANAVALQRERGLREEIEAMEAQYRQIFDASSAGIFVLDSGGRLINGNRTISKVIGLPMERLKALKGGLFISSVFGEPERVQAMADESFRRGETISADLELIPNGAKRRWVHCLISVQQRLLDDGSGRHGTIEGVIYDVTDRKSAEEAVRHEAEHDALTGLKNRAGSMLAVDQGVAAALANGASFSLLCMDLDGFKQVNDTFGHHAGDQVLATCAQRMRAAVRRNLDLVGRLGGDEFVVALNGVGPEDHVLEETAQALLFALREPIALDSGDTVRIGCSIGIACAPRHGDCRSTLTQAADEALYHVKRAGKNAFALAVLHTHTADLSPSEAIGLPARPLPHTCSDVLCN